MGWAPPSQCRASNKADFYQSTAPTPTRLRDSYIFYVMWPIVVIQPGTMNRKARVSPKTFKKCNLLSIDHSGISEVFLKILYLVSKAVKDAYFMNILKKTSFL